MVAFHIERNVLALLFDGLHVGRKLQRQEAGRLETAADYVQERVVRYSESKKKSICGRFNLGRDERAVTGNYHDYRFVSHFRLGVEYQTHISFI